MRRKRRPGPGGRLSVTCPRGQIAEEREARRRADTIVAQLTQANAALARRVSEPAAPDLRPGDPESNPEGSDRGGAPAAPARAGRGGRTGRRRGRPPGKRSNPDYVQLTCYVREENLDDAKEALMQEKRETGRKRDVSDVIDSLLRFYAQRGDPWGEIGDGRR